MLISKTQVHSAPIRGTYRLVINNTPVGIWGTSGFTVTSLPYKTNDYDLSSAFNNFYKSGEIEVRQISGSAYDDKLEFVVYYFGVTAPLEIKFDCTSLTGGVNNLFDTNYTIVRKYSTRPFFDPIPYDFLRTAETQPGLYLTLNQVPLLCQDCRYSFNSTLALTVSSASLTGTSLALALANPNSVTFSLSDVTVSFLGVGCNIQAGGTTSNFNCIFPTAANGAAAIPAGIGKPVVHVRQIGYAVTTSLANISITLQVTAFAPTTAGPAGGLQAQINGTGFPSSNSRSEIGIFLCGN